MKQISAKDVTRLLQGKGELALLDVREQGVHYTGHPFFACSAPLSRLELMVHDLVPRRAAPVVVLDGDGEGLAEKAGERLARMGYIDVAVLEGGCAAWRATGGERAVLTAQADKRRGFFTVSRGDFEEEIYRLR